MIVKLILLILTVLGLLLGTHYVLYVSTVRAFTIDHGILRKTLLCTLLFLSLSFPASLVLVKNGRNLFFEYFYILASMWMGLFLNLLLAAAIGWLIVKGVKLTGWELCPKRVAMILVTLAVLFTGYGAWKARHPQVHRIEVALEGLPEWWRNRVIVHLSDLHLGHINGRGFMAHVARTVNDLKPEMVLITGDLFDGPGGDFASFVDIIDTLDARHGVFLVIGNHEVYSASESVLNETTVRVLRNEVVEVEGIQLVGVGYPGLKGREELEQLQKGISKDRPSILLFHTPTDVVQQGEGEVDRHFATYWMPDTSCALNRELGIDLQLSGHTHAGQIFPLGLFSRLIYKGRDKGLHRDGSFQLYVSSGTGIFGPPIRTAGRSEIVVITLNTG